MVANTEEDEDSQDTINYKAQYKNLKRKLKFLMYENECFQEALRSTQRRLLKASRDRSFLLDRLLNYEKVEATSSEGEETESSDDGEIARPDAKRRKLEMNSSSSYSSMVSGLPKTPSSAKKKKPPTPKPVTKSLSQPQIQMVLGSSGDGHMTPEEVERHLEARQPHYLDMDQAVATIPSEMFSNDPSLDIDSESNELCDMETSPSNLGEDCLSVDMIAD
ncbi:INO80 complex subunit E [Macrosteles quadrilineatus]|uniref:INO80 complex subunit E n=1 Tax=Macrosteles quadrilineatus TaxID=74068 RepID=UPI0023E2FB49|nr:INO80 complex subunit E [Macrosteles quadrilineatus]